MMKSYKDILYPDTNVVPYPYGESLIALYSPIGRNIVLTDIASLDRYIKYGENSEIYDKLKEYVPIAQQKRVRAPQDYTLLTVLPNNRCNFNCSYCYSAAGRNGSEASADTIKTAIDYFIDSKPQDITKPLSISYMGGGEPMLSWAIVKETIKYAKDKCAVMGFRLNVSIITNGSIFPDDFIDFCLSHKVNVSVSFDIIREVQEQQRKHYDTVSSNLKCLCSAGINVQINTTVTPANVDRMVEMIKTVHTDYPEVKGLMLEPVTGQQLFVSADDMDAFYDVYLREFEQCLNLTDLWGISLTSFAYLRTYFPIERACPGELCLTADGNFTGCYCVGSPRDSLFDKTKYGEVLGSKAVFDLAKFDSLISEDVYKKEECADCPAKWNCGGGCYHQYNSYTAEYRDSVCRFTRAFVQMVVNYRVNRHMSKNPAVTIPVLINF